MHIHLTKNQTLLTFISLIFGIILGIIGNNTISVIAHYFVEIFINLMKFISLPIISFLSYLQFQNYKIQEHLRAYWVIP